MSDPNKPKVAVLKDEPKREQIDLDPPEPVGESVARGAKVAMLVGIPSGIVLLIGLALAAVYAFWPEPPPPVGGTMVVMPFAHGPEGQDQADAFTGDLIDDLSKVPQLQMTPKGDAMKLRSKKAAKLVDVGRELNVRYVLDGRIIAQKKDKPAAEEPAAEEPAAEGEGAEEAPVEMEYTVNVQLVNAELGAQVTSWTESGGEADLAKLRADIVQVVKENTNITPPAPQ